VLPLADSPLLSFTVIVTLKEPARPNTCVGFGCVAVSPAPKLHS
jgi:hypothetical protein